MLAGTAETSKWASSMSCHTRQHNWCEQWNQTDKLLPHHSPASTIYKSPDMAKWRHLTPIYRAKPFSLSIPVNRGPTVTCKLGSAKCVFIIYCWTIILYRIWSSTFPKVKCALLINIFNLLWNGLKFPFLLPTLITHDTGKELGGHLIFNNKPKIMWIGQKRLKTKNS